MIMHHSTNRIPNIYQEMFPLGFTIDIQGMSLAFIYLHKFIWNTGYGEQIRTLDRV